MPAWLQSVDHHWLWLSLGIFLIALEMLVPGFFMVWLGLAALATGLITWIFGPIVAVQLVLFAVFSLIILFAVRKWFSKNPIVSDDPLLNQRAHRLIGDVVVLTQSIENGRGRARVGDGEWPVQGPDLAAGNRVRICGVDGGTLLVETIES